MIIKNVIKELEALAPVSLQESYDNAGLLTGNGDWNCTGILVCLDALPAVIDEAVEKGCNMVVAHHPIVFKGLKKINGKDYVEEAMIKAIKNDVAIYAIHTNLDNVEQGVSGKMAALLGMTQTQVLQPKSGFLQQLVVFVPHMQKDQLEQAMFAAGAGQVGNYGDCSFVLKGEGSFRPLEGANPTDGKIGQRSFVEESRVEVLVPTWLMAGVISAMKAAHPYEEVAHYITDITNPQQEVGSGIIGELPEALAPEAFLALLKKTFGTPTIKYTPVQGKKIQTVALCGGAGSFLTSVAKRSGADAYVTSDIKYHEFFDAGEGMLLADIGHYESEQFTVDLLIDYLAEKFTNFAVLKTSLITNPVRYFT